VSTRPADEQQVVTMIRWLLYAVFVVVGYWIVSHVAHVIAPILVAAGIAYLLDPVLERMVARGMSRTWAATILLVSFLGAVVVLGIVLIPIAIHEVQEFITDLPRMIDNAVQWLKGQGVELPEVPLFATGELGEEGWKSYLQSPEFKAMIEDAIGPAQALLLAAVGGLFSLLAFLAELLLIPVFAYYFLLDWPNITERIKKIIPPRRRGKVLEILGEIDGVVAGWVRGQGIVTSILAVLYAIGFSIVGIHLAVPIGLLVGALTVIPFVGTFVGAAIVYLVTILDWQGVEPLVGVGIVIIVLHVLEAAVLTPKIVGHRVGLSESAALFAVVAGGKLLGFVGILLAVPIAATVAVLVRHAFRKYEKSQFFGHEDDALVPVTDAMAAVMPAHDAPGTKRKPPEGGSTPDGS
jgi:predicted PurR-regulated permease PerM